MAELFGHFEGGSELKEIMKMISVKNVDLKNLEYLIDKDVNYAVPSEVEPYVSDTEYDTEELSAQGNVKLLNRVGVSVLDKVFCVTQSYVVIVTTDNKKNTICYFCYYLHQFFGDNASYFHINTHVKRLMRHSKSDFKCLVCKKFLFVVCPSEVCLLCNEGTKNISINSDNVPSIPI